MIDASKFPLEENIKKTKAIVEIAHSMGVSKELLNISLVLHGASGVSEKAIKRAVSLGINKINIDTDIRQAFAARLRNLLEEDKQVYDPRKILGPCKDVMKEVIKKKMILFGASGRA